MASADQIPTKALAAAARVIAEGDPERDARSGRNLARRVLAAAAPHLIAEGRRQAAAEIRSRGATPGSRAEEAAEWAARIAEGTNG